jgi:uncharacterized small protein (DUF1192 family)
MISLEEMSARLLEMEKRNPRFKRVGIVALILPVLLLVLLSSVVVPAQAPAPAIPASKTAVAADRISVLELKVATLSQRIILLQNEIKLLNLEAAHFANGSRGGEADESDLESLKSDLDDKADKSDLDRLKSDLEDKADKSDLDDKADESRVGDLESKVKGLYCHFNLKTEGPFGGWPPSCF